MQKKSPRSYHSHEPATAGVVFLASWLSLLGCATEAAYSRSDARHDGRADVIADVKVDSPADSDTDGGDGGSASCEDGMQNGAEEGADCGGTCARACVDYDCIQQNEVPEVECQKLKDIYNAASGDDWTNLTNWFSNGSPCSWTGVSCDTVPGRIVNLYIKENGLAGVIARGLDVLSELNSFTMELDSGGFDARTKLHGSIPPELFELPKLERLSLRQNALTGAIPAEVSMALSLKGLVIPSNQLSGSLPAELGDLPMLEEILLEKNAFSGTLPPALGKLESLKVLRLFGNQLSGSIPAELGDLQELDRLILHNNSLSGSLPDSLGSLKKLRELFLHGNDFSGTIPAAFGGMTSLEHVLLRENGLTGSIPEAFGSLPLVQLQVGDNSLSGAIPASITTITTLLSVNMCPQAGGLKADAITGTWLRALTTSDWPAGDAC